MLGYTEVSWDNLSGEEVQPWSSLKSWAVLTENEKAAAVLLGYTEKSWDNDSGSEAQPASYNKFWSELTVCGEAKAPQYHNLQARILDLVCLCFPLPLEQYRLSYQGHACQD